MEKHNAKGNKKTRQDIGLIFNGFSLPGSCALCGSRIDGDDLQFAIMNEQKQWVCEDCVKKHTPIMIQVKKEARDYGNFIAFHSGMNQIN